MMMSPHFSYKEATVTSQPFDNKPSDAQIETIKSTAQKMELVRKLLENKSIKINSWFRSTRVNIAVGGSKTSGHLSGYCVDFTCASYGSIGDIYKKIKASNIKYDQLIHEGTWIHISFDPRTRMQAWIK
jgi:hypothetical protein